ncbi:hypothetical protein Ptr902_05575 [Pyrenophora tritici-repentis]|nr:hypothetical protein Ptr902_05575 [Pyrenophora tritici-repentis]
MASIFTFDPDPPRVSSPWATTPIGDATQPPAPNRTSKLLPSQVGKGDCTVSDKEVPTGDVEYTSIKRLEAEPQDGPTEYKLHLLLRRRRSFTRASNGRYMSGSMRRNEASIPVPVGRSVAEAVPLSNTPPPLASTQSKQHRLEQLTTQLLWRLQQSCPYHISSSTAPVLPHLPDDARLSAPEMPQRLLPGLEESKGALYEIGVADDGTIVGLAEDEMEESLNNLRAMAASLGCGIEVLRRVPVGECEWVEDAGTPQQRVLKSQLLVAEALVRPEQHLIDHTRKIQQDLGNMSLNASGSSIDLPSTPQTTTEQMRVSVTGATMSGKSTLLGTLSTATQPHWTLLCVPSDNSEDSSGKLGASPTSEELLGPAAAGFDLSHAHLQLCLALELPLVIAITKYDLATKNGLRSTIVKLFTALREHGRKPFLITDPSTSVLEADLHTVEASDLNETDKTIELLKESPLAAVPVVLTSAIKGIGIQKLHAFLRRLPMPTEETNPPSGTPSTLFYIEDVYSVRTSTSANSSTIIGGHLRYGSLTIGDELLLGPYSVDISSDDSDSGSGTQPTRKLTISQSRSFPGALNTKSKNTLLRDRHSEWRRVRITSLRNLRLPVRTLHVGQVGTMGIIPVDTPPLSSPSINRIRKGMVLCASEAKAHKTITVRFQDKQAQGIKGLSVGTAVVVYIASVRASSKVVSVALETVNAPLPPRTSQDDDDAFGFGFEDEADEMDMSGSNAPPAVIVTFQFIASREFVEEGARVLIMPGGGGPGLFGSGERGAKGMAGLEGFVGRLVEDGL